MPSSTHYYPEDDFEQSNFDATSKQASDSSVDRWITRLGQIGTAVLPFIPGKVEAGRQDSPSNRTTTPPAVAPAAPGLGFDLNSIVRNPLLWLAGGLLLFFIVRRR